MQTPSGGKERGGVGTKVVLKQENEDERRDERLNPADGEITAAQLGNLDKLFAERVYASVCCCVRPCAALA